MSETRIIWNNDGRHLSGATQPPSGLSADASGFRDMLLRAGFGLLAAIVVMSVAMATTRFSPENAIMKPFRSMDVVFGTFAAVVMIAMARLARPTEAVAGIFTRLEARSRLSASFIALAAVLVGWAGTFVVMQNFHHSRDEQMAAMDAAIFASGSFFAAVPSEWQPYAEALQPTFTLFSNNFTHWASHYFPVNAAWRALFLKVGLAELANPVLVGLTVIVTWGIARKLWPDRRDAAVVAALLVALSSQVLLMSMTPWAMTMHMALSAVWLHCWLRDDAAGHAGAMLTGALATGIHQVAFHPLFAAPFVLSLLAKRRFRLFAVYVAAYAVICFGWLGYWSTAAHLSGIGLQIVSGAGVGDMWSRVMVQINRISHEGVLLIPFQVLKFVVWQHIAFLPLFLFGLARFRDLPESLKLSLYGALATLAMLFLLLPNQWFGWGYRYLHGFIGPAALIAAYGWVALVPRRAADGRLGGHVPSFLAVSTAMTLAVTIPGYSYKVREFLMPNVAVANLVKSARTEVVVIDAAGARHSADMVENDAFLRNTPKMLLIENLTDAQIRHLCATTSVAFVGTEHIKALGLFAFEPESLGELYQVVSAKRALMSAIGCMKPLPLPR